MSHSHHFLEILQIMYYTDLYLLCLYNFCPFRIYCPFINICPFYIYCPVDYILTFINKEISVWEGRLWVNEKSSWRNRLRITISQFHNFTKSAEKFLKSGEKCDTSGPSYIMYICVFYNKMAKREIQYHQKGQKIIS